MFFQSHFYVKSNYLLFRSILSYIYNRYSLKSVKYQCIPYLTYSHQNTSTFLSSCFSFLLTLWLLPDFRHVCQSAFVLPPVAADSFLCNLDSLWNSLMQISDFFFRLFKCYLVMKWLLSRVNFEKFFLTPVTFVFLTALDKSPSLTVPGSWPLCYTWIGYLQGNGPPRALTVFARGSQLLLCQQSLIADSSNLEMAEALSGCLQFYGIVPCVCGVSCLTHA